MTCGVTDICRTAPSLDVRDARCCPLRDWWVQRTKLSNTRDEDVPKRIIDIANGVRNNLTYGRREHELVVPVPAFDEVEEPSLANVLIERTALRP